MFDYPEPTQTSPTRRPSTLILLSPEIVITNGPPGCRLFDRSTHCSSLSAAAPYSLPSRNLTAICSPGAPLPLIDPLAGL